MRLLLTRAEPEAQSSAERLRQRGHQVLVAPMLEIAFVPAPAALSEPRAIAFTSANAARAVAAWPQARAWTEIPAFAVGDTTAEAARAAGFRDIHFAKGGSVELAALIGRTLRPDDRPILYPTAEVVSGDLPGALREAGFVVERATAYRADAAARLPPKALAALKAQNLDAALFYSERGAATFVELATREGLAEALTGLRLLALSVQVAGPLRHLAPAPVSVAAEPTEASLLALLASGD